MKKNASPIRTTTGTFATLALALCLAGLANSAQAQQLPAGVCTVTPNGTPTGTWLSPKKLEAALADASCTTLWLMQGTYTQTANIDGFLIDRNLQLYGGFTGDETAFASRPSNVDSNLTKLDGETLRRVLLIDGTATNGPITNATVIDGVSIQNGKAPNAVGNPTRGGGIYCIGSGAGHDCSPSINNATFSRNMADLGGAISNEGNSSPSISNATFSSNRAESYGGAIFNQGNRFGASSPNITHSVFNENTAFDGGALYNDGTNGNSSPTITDSVFTGNSARGTGGALYNAGFSSGTSSPSISNTTFSGNSASDSGGAMFNSGYYAGTSSPSITNSTFGGNSAHHNGGGGAIFSVTASNGTSKPTIIASIFWGNTADFAGAQINNYAAVPNISYSIVQGSGGSTNWDSGLGTSGLGNLDADPLLGALADNGGPTPTMMPGVSSAAIDPLDASTSCPATDQRGLARPTGPAAKCHIGAVHVRSDSYKLTVKVAGSGSVTGSPGVPTNGSGNLENCAAANSPCTATYFGENDPSSVLLKAVTPPGGSIFSGWSGDDCDGSTASSCSVTMDAAKSITATFIPFAVNANNPVNGTYGTNYLANLTPTHTGGVGTVSYAQTSSTHPDLVYDPVQGTVSGPATIPAGTYSISITATDANGATTLPTSFSITIDKAAQHIVLNSDAPTEAKVGGSYTVLTTPGASSSALTLEVSGPCSIAGNVVTFNATGACTITAKQLGDMNYLDAVPATRTVQVVQGASGVNISSTPNPSQPGQAVTFTVSVALDTTKTAALKTKAAAVPTGMVSISDNGAILGSAPLVNGLATVSTQLLTKVGSHSIVASYSGDATYPATTSVPFTQTVTEAAVTPVATPVPTLNEWALIGLTALLALVGASRMRRRSA